MLNRCSSCGAPLSARQAWFKRPEFGAASNSQAIAPRNGGVTNEAVTSARMVRRNGMSVRATSQPIGAAIAQQITADEVARITVVHSGSVKVGSLTSLAKLSSVKRPLSVTLKNTSHDIGSTISAHSTAAKPIRIGHEGSKRVRRAGIEAILTTSTHTPKIFA
jgi:hypothetical protein